MYAISITVSQRERSVVGKRKKRAVSTTTSINLNFRSYKCFYEDCVVPPDPSTLPPPNTRPADAIFWSNTSTWPNDTLPVNGDSVTIEEGKLTLFFLSYYYYSKLWFLIRSPLIQMNMTSIILLSS